VLLEVISTVGGIDRRQDKLRCFTGTGRNSRGSSANVGLGRADGRAAGYAAPRTGRVSDANRKPGRCARAAFQKASDGTLVRRQKIKDGRCHHD